jgi:hypothetical protein
MSRCLRFQITLFFLISLCWTGSLFATTAQSSEQQLKQSINSLYRARTTIINNHLEEEQSDPGSPVEKSDFLLFLSYLDGRILYYCDQLFSLGGESSLNGLPCPVDDEGKLETSSYTPLPTVKVQTDREKTASLDNELQASLGSFDDYLLNEQEEIAATVPTQREGSSYNRAGAKEGGGYNDDRGEGGEVQKKSSGATAASSTRTTSTNRGSGVGSTNQSRHPPTSGNKDLSQNDDDIVARQLREAAEQESDPEVKARLWEEYRKYKQGVD